MKKTLAIVLALAMVLCMIPALSADSIKLVSDRSYNVKVYEFTGKGTFKQIADSNGLVNSLTVEYSNPAEVTTGRYTEDKAMAVVELKNFDFVDPTKVKSISINGKTLSVADEADYAASCGAVDAGQINFPVELTDEGYTATYTVVVVSSENNVTTTETAAVTLTLVNKTPAADVKKTAYITNIAAGKILNADGTLSSTAAKADVYIVGSKIYVDYKNDKGEPISIDVTYGDENKAAFSVIAWAQPTKVTGFDLSGSTESKLSSSSKVTYKFDPNKYTYGTKVYDKLTSSSGDIVLDTKDAKYYLDKDYTIVVRTGIKEADPKGIYLESAAATIAIGEEYTPVLKAVETGKVITPSAIVIYDSFMKESTAVLDYVTADGLKYIGSSVIGTKAGVAYIKCAYTNLTDKQDILDAISGNIPNGYFFYLSSAQKITVTEPGEKVPASVVEYTVSCRKLNVRKGSGTSYAKAGSLTRGTTVKVVEIANGWAKLEDGTYVCAKYITK